MLGAQPSLGELDDLLRPRERLGPATAELRDRSEPAAVLERRELVDAGGAAQLERAGVGELGGPRVTAIELGVTEPGEVRGLEDRIGAAALQRRRGVARPGPARGVVADVHREHRGLGREVIVVRGLGERVGLARDTACDRGMTKGQHRLAEL